MKPAASDASSTAAPPTSDAVPKRCMGVRISSSRPRGVPSSSAWLNSVRKTPGAIALTLMPRRAHSTARLRVRPSTAAFDAAYAVTSVRLTNEFSEAMLMMRPRPLSASGAMKTWQARSVAVAFTSKTCCHSGIVSSLVGLRRIAPAELTSTSRWPNASSTAVRSATIDSWSRTSTGRSSDRRPRSRTRWQLLRTCSSRRPVGTTSAPASARAHAIAWPMPEVPPMTTATRPSRFKPANISEANGRLSVRQRLPVGFRREGQNHQSDEEHEGHRNAGIPHRLVHARIHAARQQSERQGSERRDEASDVVAERCSRAAQPGGEELREIDGESAEQRQLTETHDRDHPEDVAEITQVPESERGGDECQNVGDGERLAAANTLRQMHERIDAGEPAEVLEQRNHARPRGLRTLAHIGAVEHGAEEIDGKEADAPQANDAGERQRTAHESIAPPSRIREQLRDRAALLAGLRHTLPSLGLLQVEEDGNRQQRRYDTDDKHGAPRALDGARGFECTERDANHCRQHVAPGRGRLQPAERVRARAVWQCFRHQRDAHGELATHAEAGQEPVEGERPEERRVGKGGR